MPAGHTGGLPPVPAPRNWRRGSYVPPPAANARVDDDDDDGEYAKEQPHSRGVAGGLVAEGLGVHKRPDDLGRIVRAALRDDVDVVEDQERPDDRHERQEHKHGPDGRQRDVPELSPG